MADTQFSGADWSQYPSWERVTLPDGGNYYRVPGSGYIYDEFLSRVKGRPVLRADPTPQLNEADRQRKAQEQAQSPMGQAIPILGSTAATLGGAYLANQLIGTGAAAIPAAPVIANGVTAAASGAAGASTGAAAGGIGAASGAAAGEAAATPVIVNGATGLGFGASLGLGVGVGAGAALASKGIQDGLAQKKTDWGANVDTASRLQAAASTFGFSELGRLAGVKIGHETTKATQARRWTSLIKDNIAGAEQQANALFSLGDMAGKDPVTGEKWKFDVALDRVKNGATNEFNGVYGNFKTFGNDWSTYSDQQKNDITRAIANANLYESKKGDVLIKDAEAARKIKDQVLGGNPAPVVNDKVQRSSTRSPGIDKDGERIATLLAKRADARRR